MINFPLIIGLFYAAIVCLFLYLSFSRENLGTKFFLTKLRISMVSAFSFIIGLLINAVTLPFKILFISFMYEKGFLDGQLHIMASNYKLMLEQDKEEASYEEIKDAFGDKEEEE